MFIWLCSRSLIRVWAIISALGHDYNKDCPPDVVVTLLERAYDKEAAGVGWHLAVSYYWFPFLLN